jgi:hypothetical protein
MTHAEQHRMILELKEFSHTMGGRDRDEFEMFLKRDRDDEDLDEISRKRLVQMVETYVRRRPRPR